MLKLNEISPVFPIAQVLANNGIELRPFHGEVLSGLVAAADTMTDIAPDDVERVLFNITAPIKTGAVGEDNVEITLPCEHEYIRSRVVERMSAGLRKVVSMSRDIAVPMIKNVLDNVDKDLAEAVTPPSPELVVYEYAGIWSSLIVDGIADRFDDMKPVGMPLVKLPELTDEQLATIITSGSSDMAEFVASMQEKNPGVVRAIYDIWFRNGYVSDQDDFAYLSRALVTTTYAQHGVTSRELILRGNDNLDLRKSYDMLILAYLMADNLYDNPIPDVEGGWGMNLDDYNMVMSAFRANYGMCIARVYNVRLQNAKSKMMYIDFPVITTMSGMPVEIIGRLVLNGDVYRWYLEQHGSIEAVLGNAISDRVISGRTVLDQRERFEQKYNNYLATTKLATDINRRQIIATSLTKHLIATVRGVSDEQWGKWHSDGKTRLDVTTDIRNYLSGTGSNPITESVRCTQVIYAVTLLICNSPEANEFIIRMNNYKDQTQPPRVIAAHVVCELLVASLLDQVERSQ